MKMKACIYQRTLGSQNSSQSALAALAAKGSSLVTMGTGAVTNDTDLPSVVP